MRQWRLPPREAPLGGIEGQVDLLQAPLRELAHFGSTHNQTAWLPFVAVRA
jgi:hypothetical protein